MITVRRKRGFHSAGELSIDQLGLPRGRARELMLARAWQRVAGEAVARRVDACEGRGGVLVLRVRDERWASVLRELLPRLAARLAAHCPELRVHRFKLEGVAGDAEGALPLPPPPLDESESGTSGSQPRPVADPGTDRPLAERLEQLARIYLARQNP